MKHTKGTWEVNKNPFIHIESDGRWICQINDLKNDKPFLTDEYEAEEKNLKEQEIANAKLIAASPDLLEALQWIEHHALQDGCSKESLMAVAKAAIKKATE